MGVAEQACRFGTVVQVDHCGLGVAVGVRPEFGTQRPRADALYIRLANDAPVVIHVVTDQILNIDRQVEVGVRVKASKLFVEDVTGCQSTQLDWLARLVALEEVSCNREAADAFQLEPCCLD